MFPGFFFVLFGMPPKREPSRRGFSGRITTCKHVRRQKISPEDRKSLSIPDPWLILEVFTKTLKQDITTDTLNRRELQFREALREARSEEMRRDPRVFLMGEEVAEDNGAYKVYQGMLDEFGPERHV